MGASRLLDVSRRDSIITTVDGRIAKRLICPFLQESHKRQDHLSVISVPIAKVVCACIRGHWSPRSSTPSIDSENVNPRQPQIVGTYFVDLSLEPRQCVLKTNHNFGTLNTMTTGTSSDRAMDCALQCRHLRVSCTSVRKCHYLGKFS